MSRATAARPRIAALPAWLAGVGFGLPGVYAIWYFAQHHSVWTFLGYPTYGGGPFEAAGIATTMPLLVSFLLVCLAEVVAGWMLWRNHPAAPIVSLALLPVEFAFWIGFALPAGPVLGLARTALVLPAPFTPAIPPLRWMLTATPRRDQLARDDERISPDDPDGADHRHRTTRSRTSAASHPALSA